MLPRLWLLVGSDQGTKGPRDRQCHLLSCPGQLKRIGSEWPDKDKSNMNSIAWKIHFLFSEGPESPWLSNDYPTQTRIAWSPGTGMAYFPPSFHSFGNCKDIKSLKAWHPTLCKSHPRRLCLVSHFFLHPGREIHTSSRVQSPSSSNKKYMCVSSWSQCDPSPHHGKHSLDTF